MEILKVIPWTPITSSIFPMIRYIRPNGEDIGRVCEIFDTDSHQALPFVYAHGGIMVLSSGVHNNVVFHVKDDEGNITEEVPVWTDIILK